MTTKMKLSSIVPTIFMGVAMAYQTLVPSQVNAEEIDLTPKVSTTLGLDSKYVCGNGAISVDNTTAKFIPNLNLGKRISFDVFTAYDFKKDKVIEVSPEINVDAIRTKHLNASLYAGLFTFPNVSGPNAGEVGITLTPTLPDYMPLDTNIYAGQIFGKGSSHGQLIKTYLGKSFSPLEKLSLSLGAKLIFNNNYFSDKSGFSHVNGIVGMSYQLGENLNISANINRQEPVGKFKDSLTRETYGGIAVTNSF